MAHAAGDAHEYPVYGYHFRLAFPILDADGDFVTGATGLDSEVSIDCGTAGDCVNEATEIATNSGMYYLDVTGAEMSGKIIVGMTKTSSVGAKTTPWILYPRRLKSITTGTAAAGAAGTITLAAATIVSNGSLDGMFVGITNNSPAGAQYQLRRIIASVASTQVATVDSNWGTNPSSASTYEILAADTVNIGAWGGTYLRQITTAGIPDVDASYVAGSQNTLKRSAGGIIYFTAATGTLSQFTSDITGYSDSNLVGRAGLWLSGSNKGLPFRVSGYTSTGGLVTMSGEMGATVANGDTGVM